MIVKSDMKWYEWQKHALKNIFDNPHATHIIKSKRQTGKSVMCESIIIKFTLERKNAFSLYVSPTYKQARKVFREIVKALSDTNLVSGSSESTLEIKFINGGIIQFASAEQGATGLQGYTVTGVLIIDESAFIPDDIYFALTPTVDANNSPMIIVSTPRFKKGFFYDLYERAGKNEQGLFRYDWALYDTSALLSESKLQQYRAALPETIYKQYYLGLFCDINSESAFRDFMHVIKDTYSPRYIKRGPFDDVPEGYYTECYAGIDWGSGTGRDMTAISIFNNLKQQIYLKYFNDKDETETIKEIIDILKKHRPNKVKSETNGIGSVMSNLLQKAITKEKISTNFIKFNTSNNTKNKIINQLQVSIQNSEITLLSDEEQINQLSHYLPELTKSGKVTYNAEQGYHDDIVIADALALDCCISGNYVIL